LPKEKRLKKLKNPGTRMKKIKIDTLLICLPVLFFTALAFIPGCLTRSSRMVPEKFEVTKKIHGSVRVDEVVGSRETNSFQLWMSQVSGVAFTEALADSIAKANLFDAVVKTDSADYILDVTILSYDQPFGIGLDLDIKMKTKWELTGTKKFVPVWSDTFEIAYKARFSDALLPAEKSQKAYEGAIRAAIAEGIKRLSEARF
jgi:hypothetical protein